MLKSKRMASRSESRPSGSLSSLCKACLKAPGLRLVTARSNRPPGPSSRRNCSVGKRPRTASAKRRPAAQTLLEGPVTVPPAISGAWRKDEPMSKPGLSQNLLQPKPRSPSCARQARPNPVRNARPPRNATVSGVRSMGRTPANSRPPRPWRMSRSSGNVSFADIPEGPPILSCNEASAAGRIMKVDFSKTWLSSSGTTWAKGARPPWSNIAKRLPMCRARLASGHAVRISVISTARAASPAGATRYTVADQCSPASRK
mmetsp:Transcript_112095/g.313387  ORF Transcript_112095/g.313387 Transcript_112095/m.313387 type:complete len:259 (+) Transcript_112095:519-1295(+)